jgi:hypothetical protein
MSQRKPRRTTERVEERDPSVTPLRLLEGAGADHDGAAVTPHAAAVLAGRDGLRAMIEAALPIARERASLVLEMQGALERGDERLALTLAYRLVGVKPPLSIQP